MDSRLGNYASQVLGAALSRKRNLPHLGELRWGSGSLVGGNGLWKQQEDSNHRLGDLLDRNCGRILAALQEPEEAPAYQPSRVEQIAAAFRKPADEEA